MTTRKRIWGWYFFDWASQPYYTLMLTFVFGPFFAATASSYFLAQGLSDTQADAKAQEMWSWALTVCGLIIAFSAPIMGKIADTQGRRLPWIMGFSTMFVLGAGAAWFTDPNGSNLVFALCAFSVGFIGAELALIFTNAQLPDLGDDTEVGAISGSGFAFGYAGGLAALIVVLVFFVEQDNGRTIAGLEPLFGLLDPTAKEGTRAVTLFVALWFMVFMIPYFRSVVDGTPTGQKLSPFGAFSEVKSTVVRVFGHQSLRSYLISSMFYRDAMNGLYSFGAIYATLVLDWSLTLLGVFGIVSALAAAAFSWLGGFWDRKAGPKPVIITCILTLTLVCITIVGMTREAIFGIPLEQGSVAPDAIFFGCGVIIGGLGGILQSASRSMMVRHTTPERATEAFGLYGLSGRATAFLAPFSIAVVTALTENARLGVTPLIVLFGLGLLFIFKVNANGDRSAWE